jgi:hypothetical protein
MNFSLQMIMSRTVAQDRDLLLVEPWRHPATVTRPTQEVSLTLPRVSSVT